MTQSDELYPLSDRAILTISGADRKKFLQGLITNDVEKLSGTPISSSPTSAPPTTVNLAIYAALLTAQGKYLHDFFITEVGETLYLDCERVGLPDLFKRLMMYRLRADVTIIDGTDDFDVMASGQPAPDAVVNAQDPRHKAMGYRVILKATEKRQPPYDINNHYDELRLTWGLPDGSRDFNRDKTLILEGNIEDLNGVDFDKGCYVGQEVTARMKHRTSLKKRLLPVKLDGDLPPHGTEITNEAGKKIGDLRSGKEGRAIGYFRLADMTYGTAYACGNSRVTPWRPDWLKDPT